MLLLHYIIALPRRPHLAQIAVPFSTLSTDNQQEVGKWDAPKVVKSTFVCPFPQLFWYPTTGGWWTFQLLKDRQLGLKCYTTQPTHPAIQPVSHRDRQKNNNDSEIAKQLPQNGPSNRWPFIASSVLRLLLLLLLPLLLLGDRVVCNRCYMG